MSLECSKCSVVNDIPHG